MWDNQESEELVLQEDEVPVLSDNVKPFDILSNRFADFALDEIDEAPTLSQRAEITIAISGQEVKARVLGFGTSFTDTAHTGHMPGTPPAKGERCPACRWADVAILGVAMAQADAEKHGVMYLVALMGKSEVPGESHRIKTVWTEDPMKVLESLIVTGKLPYTNAQAFRAAAEVDNGIRRVCEAHDDAIPSPERKPRFADWDH